MPRPSAGNPSSESSANPSRVAATSLPERRPNLVTCRMSVILPPSTWLHSLTVAHPDCRIEVMDRLLLTDRLMLTEARLLGLGFQDMVSEVERLPTVEQVEVLEEDTLSGLVRVTHRVPDFIRLFRQLRVLRRFPFWVREGTATWVVVGSAAKLSRLLEGLSRSVPQVRVDAIQPTTPHSKLPLLTRRESELFRRAMIEGYFDVPRRVSLTALADRVNLAKSTLSRTLAIVERKLLSEVGESLLKRTPDGGPPEPVR
jgi:predicted DNA binding protein